MCWILYAIFFYKMCSMKITSHLNFYNAIIKNFFIKMLTNFMNLPNIGVCKLFSFDALVIILNNFL